MDYTILTGDCRQTLATMATGSVQTCITSPPYFGLRDYGMPDQLGLEQTPAAFVAELVGVLREVWRVLADDGTLWLNLGDSYAHSTKNTDSFTRSRTECSPGTLRKHGLKVRDLIGIPWRVAFALQDDGWYLRQDIIWHKPNPMPESVTSRCTKAHEYIFLLSKQPKYYFDAKAMQEPVAPSQVGRVRADRVGGTSHKERGQHSIGHVYTGARPRVENTRKELRTDTESRHRSSIPGGQSLQAEPDGTRNRRSVWTVATQPYAGAHFATFPPELIRPCVLAGSRPGDVVLDCFNGSGTTGFVALQEGRNYMGCELNPEYVKLTHERLAMVQPRLQFGVEKGGVAA
jgi:DNA modification methylase